MSRIRGSEYLGLFQDTEQNITDILSEDSEDEGRYGDANNFDSE
jgi:hypothetical protein